MKLRRFLRRNYWDRERALEVESHLQHEIDDNLARGMTSEEARRHAYLKFGNPTRIREEIRQMNSLPTVEALWRDVKYALRQMRKSLGFTTTAVLTVALGIGVTVCTYTLFNQVLLRKLPVRQPDRLVRFYWTGDFAGSTSSFGGSDHNYFSYPMYKALEKRNRVFGGTLAAVRTDFGIAYHGHANDEAAELVSGNYFQVLGLHPALGRLLTSADETTKNANAVAVLSYDYWRTHLAASRHVIGQTLQINGYPFAIVGVAPRGFRTAIGGYRPDVFVPLTMVDIAMPSMTPRHNLDNPKSLWLTLAARLKPDVTREQAQASLAPLWHALRAQDLSLYSSVSPGFRKGFLDESHLQVLGDARGFSPERAQLKTPLLVLLSMAGLLTAICVLNLSMLLLLRAGSRTQEMSTRYALGARFRHIALQLLLEGGLLGAAGAIAGILLSPVLAAELEQLIVGDGPGSNPYSTAIDGHVLWFSILLTVGVTLLFSVAPILHFLRPNITMTLRERNASLSKSGHLFRKLTVGTQIAMCVLLLGGAGLFVHTLENLRDQPIGFNPAHLITFSIDPSGSGYSKASMQPLLESVLDKVRAVPGVTQAAATDDPELVGEQQFDGYKIAGYHPPKGDNLTFESPWITPRYFATLDQPLLAGRDFTRADGAGAPGVAIVNLALAKLYFGSAEQAMGHRIGLDGAKAPDIRIVGVVGDARHVDLRTPSRPTVYRPYLQNPNPDAVSIYVRSPISPDVMEPEIRRTIRALAPALVVTDMLTMEQQINLSASDERALAILAATYALLAALLAGIGLYGVLSFATQIRRREFGVRIALGSSRRAVVGLVVAEMAGIAVLAVVVAVPSTIALARLFRSQLYGVSTFDPWSVVGAVVFACVMLILASALPALRAASVDPIRALRAE